MTRPSDRRPASEGLEPDAARQSVKTGHLRWVLSISLLLGVLALGGAFAWYESASHSRPAAEQAQAR